MAPDRSTEMAREDIHSFLGRGGTGVLSLAASDEPYSTPVSYGFDPTEGAFYFRLGSADGGEKRRFLEASSPARFVVYDRTGDGWRSVVAVGPLERVAADALDVEVARGLQHADLPLYGIWDVPRDAIEFEVYRLVPEELTGRKTAGDGLE